MSEKIAKAIVMIRLTAIEVLTVMVVHMEVEVIVTQMDIDMDGNHECGGQLILIFITSMLDGDKTQCVQKQLGAYPIVSTPFFCLFSLRFAICEIF